MALAFAALAFFDDDGEYDDAYEHEEEPVKGMFGSSGGLLGLGPFYERLMILVILAAIAAIVWDFVNDFNKREKLRGRRKVRGRNIYIYIYIYSESVCDRYGCERWASQETNMFIVWNTRYVFISCTTHTYSCCAIQEKRGFTGASCIVMRESPRARARDKNA